MSDIPLRIVDTSKVLLEDRQPGDMWRIPYESTTDGQETWMIMLPGNAFWYTTLKDSQGRPWDVTGDPPNITVLPSIQVAGGWHGWITNGKLVTI